MTKCTAVYKKENSIYWSNLKEKAKQYYYTENILQFNRKTGIKRKRKYHKQKKEERIKNTECTEESREESRNDQRVEEPVDTRSGSRNTDWSVLMDRMQLGMKANNTDISQRPARKGSQKKTFTKGSQVGLKNKWGAITSLKPVNANGSIITGSLAIKGIIRGKVKANPRSESSLRSPKSGQRLISSDLTVKKPSAEDTSDEKC